MSLLIYNTVIDIGIYNVGSDVVGCFATCYSRNRACRLIDVIRTGRVTSRMAVYSSLHILLTKMVAYIGRGLGSDWSV